jgi:hypothetical protein
MPLALSLAEVSVLVFSLVAQPRASASAAAFSRPSCVGLVERVEGLLVDDHRVLGQPGLGVVVVLEVLVGLGVVAGGARAHVDSTTPVAMACDSSAACTVTGWAPTSSAMRAVAGL